ALLLTEGSLGEGLWLVFAAGAIFGVAVDLALDQADRFTRAGLGALGYAASAVPLLAGFVLASGPAILAAELPRLVAFAVLHGLLLGWVTPQGYAVRAPGQRVVSVRWPTGLRRAVALTVLLPWLWAVALAVAFSPHLPLLILGVLAIGISILCALPAL